MRYGCCCENKMKGFGAAVVQCAVWELGRLGGRTFLIRGFIHTSNVGPPPRLTAPLLGSYVARAAGRGKRTSHMPGLRQPRRACCKPSWLSPALVTDRARLALVPATGLDLICHRTQARFGRQQRSFLRMPAQAAALCIARSNAHQSRSIASAWRYNASSSTATAGGTATATTVHTHSRAPPPPLPGVAVRPLSRPRGYSPH